MLLPRIVAAGVLGLASGLVVPMQRAPDLAKRASVIACDHCIRTETDAGDTCMGYVTVAWSTSGGQDGQCPDDVCDELHCKWKGSMLFTTALSVRVCVNNGITTPCKPIVMGGATFVFGPGGDLPAEEAQCPNGTGYITWGIDLGPGTPIICFGFFTFNCGPCD